MYVGTCVSVPRSSFSYFWKFFHQKVWASILCVPHSRPSYPPLFRRPDVWQEPVPVAAQSKARICGRPLAVIAGSNPSGGMDVCGEYCVVRWRSVRQADRLSGGVLPSVVCLSVIVLPRQWGGPGSLGAVAPWQNRIPVNRYQSRSSSLCTVHHLLLFSPSWTPAPYFQTVCFLSHYPDASRRN